MHFAVNAQNLIYMAVDTVNGNVNLNFLVRLLEAMALRMNLDRYEVDFVGNDARRAQTVYSGGPDPIKFPLDSEFTLKIESEIDILSDKQSVLSFTENEDENATEEMVSIKRKRRRKVKKNKKILPKMHYKLPPYDVDYTNTKIQNDGAINLEVLKQIENTIFTKPVFRENKERLSFLIEKITAKPQENTMQAETPASETLETMKLVPKDSMDRVSQVKASILSDKDIALSDKDTILSDKDTRDTQNLNTIEHVVTKKPKKEFSVKTSSSVIYPRKKSTKPKDKVPNLPSEFIRTHSSDSLSVSTDSSSETESENTVPSDGIRPYLGPKYMRKTKNSLRRKNAFEKVKKEVRIIASPTEVFEPKIFAPNAFRKDDHDFSNLNTDLIDAVGVRLLEVEEECFRRKIKRSLTHERIIQDTAIDKYILKNHEPVLLKEHIEKILSRLNKLEHQTQTLTTTVNIINDCAGDLSFNETDSDCDEFSILKREQQEPKLDVRLKKLAKNYLIPSKFHSEFGGDGTINGKVSVNKFKTFFNDYMEKFQIIYDYIESNEKQIYEIKLRTETKLDIETFKLFERIVKSTHEKTYNFIDTYLHGEQDASGMVQYIKGGACVSCAKPVKMRKTTNVKQSSKGVSKPRESMAPFRAYDMIQARKERSNVKFKDPENLKTIACYCTVDPGRTCENDVTKKSRENVIFAKGITSRKTPLSDWIRDHTPRIKMLT